MKKYKKLDIVKEFSELLRIYHASRSRKEISKRFKQIVEEFSLNSTQLNSLSAFCNNIPNIYNKTQKLVKKKKPLSFRNIISEFSDVPVYFRTLRKILINSKIFDLSYYRLPNEKKKSQYDDAKKRTLDIKLEDKSLVYLITSVQNNTPVHKPLWFNLLSYKEYLEKFKKKNVKIIVIPFRYKNPTSLFIDSENEVWDPLVQEYLYANREIVGDWVIAGDVKIQPTAINPLVGIYRIGKSKNIIFGHTKQHMITVPTTKGYSIVSSTGCITKMNYTDSRIGKQGEFNHVYGFVYLEPFNNEFRYISALKDGSFQDVVIKVKNQKVSEDGLIEGIVLGDIHYGINDKRLYNISLNFIKKHSIKNIVLHDVFDGYSISHHNEKKILVRYYNKIGGNNLKKELTEVINNLKHLSNMFLESTIYIVKSNHDEFLDRWITSNMISDNLENLFEYGYIITEMIKNKRTEGALETYVQSVVDLKNVRFLKRREILKIKNWVVSYHGDVCNGERRPSPNSFRKLNEKMIIGHFHSPCRLDNIAVVGTVVKPEDAIYIKGFSSWACSHVIILENGKIQHIFVT